MKRTILSILFLFVTYVFTSAQQWVQIRQTDNVYDYIRVDVVPQSPQNLVQFWTGYSLSYGKSLMKQYSYSGIPRYDETTYAFNDSFDYYASRLYEVFDEKDKSLYKAFHGFLTYDTIYGQTLLSTYADWAALLKYHGASACVYASNTQFQKQQKPEWIKIDEDESATYFIRVDLTNEDSLAMFGLVFKSKTSKDWQKYYSFKEAPQSRILVYKIHDQGSKYSWLAESWFGKKDAITGVWLYPKTQPSELTEFSKKLVEWGLLLLEQGKDAVVEKSNTKFGKIVK